MKAKFQFHKGTIKTRHCATSQRRFSHFNSIKVRLKRHKEDSAGADPSFQFHKGTIKTVNEQVEYLRIVTDFNSIKVRLKLFERNKERVFHSNFNSIKVRLKL